MKLWTTYDAILKYMARGFETLGMLALVILMLMLGVQTAASWGGISILWSDEICFMMNFWIVFIGGAVLMYEKRHIEVNIVFAMFPRKGRWILEVLRAGVCIFVCVYMMSSTILYIRSTKNVLTTVLKMPKILYYLVPVLAFGYFILAFIHQFWGAYCKFKEDQA